MSKFIAGQVIMPVKEDIDWIECPHKIQEEIGFNVENSARRMMRCCACGKEFWVLREDLNGE